LERAAFRHSCTISPGTADVNSPGANIGQALQEATNLHQQGRLREAEKIYARVLKAAPDQFDALHLLGTLKAQTGHAGEAHRLISAALRINPRAADAWTNLGFVLHGLKRDPEALDCFDKALALTPNDADAHHNRGNMLLTLGRLDDALVSLDQAVALAPRHTEALLNRGIALGRLERHVEAIAAFDAALALAPGHPIAQYNRGLSLFNLARYSDAVAAYDGTLAAIPNHVGALNNRGLALQAINRHRDAVASFDRAIALQKDYADAHFNTALALLTLGDFRRGFEEYEFRWQRTGMPATRRGSGRPSWRGDYPLQGRTILLQAEQGLGDTIQFARYVPLLAKAGAKVVLEVQPELKALLTPIEGAATVVGRGEPLPAFDLHCALGSLPLACKTEPATIPAGIPYLTASAERIETWRASLPSDGLRVVIAWSGSPKHVNDRNRSIPFAQLGALWETPGVRFISVQRDLRGDDAELLAREPRVMQVGPELTDFSDTAAVVALADLVISVDTSVAHLAGALGKPVWILLPHSPDWRWGLEGNKSRWYPTARMFRQAAPGQWDGVIADVAAELQKRAAR
jgi:tetratricopeptide (TPR) repeat protein